MPAKYIPVAVQRAMDARFQEQNELLARMMERLDALAPPAPAPPAVEPNAAPVPAAPAPPAPPVAVNAPVPVAQPEVLHVGEPIYERFRRQRPPSFDGSPDPVEAEDWLKKIQRIFAYMRLEDHEKVACAVHQLEKEASCWWEYVALSEGQENVTWEIFL